MPAEEMHINTSHTVHGRGKYDFDVSSGRHDPNVWKSLTNVIKFLGPYFVAAFISSVLATVFVYRVDNWDKYLRISSSSLRIFETLKLLESRLGSFAVIMAILTMMTLKKRYHLVWIILGIIAGENGIPIVAERLGGIPLLTAMPALCFYGTMLWLTIHSHRLRSQLLKIPGLFLLTGILVGDMGCRLHFDKLSVSDLAASTAGAVVWLGIIFAGLAKHDWTWFEERTRPTKTVAKINH